MRERLARSALAIAVVLSMGATAACDREDQRDVEEVGNDIDKEVDQLDSDGKDD